MKQRHRVDGALSAAGFVVWCVAGLGCAGGGPAPRTVEGQTYGQTQTPFRERWWQYYERGVSWGLGGFWPEAEADLRSCLAQRRTDSRRARTYGMHFVQCFAHRELGAVLIERGRLDEAEREIRASIAQEPSAKADSLLERIRALRGGADAAAATARPERVDVVIERVVEAGAEPGTLAVTGRLVGATALAAVGDAGARRDIPLDPGGAFAVALVPGERLVAEAADRPPLAVTPSLPQAAPLLALDGPEEGRVVADAHVFYRYDARAADGLATLAVECDGAPIATRALSGVQTGGTLALALEPGPHRLRFTARDAAGASAALERSLTLAPRATQDRRFRATALLVPLASPRDGRAPESLDDPRLAAAVQDDGRFRIVDGRADAAIAREARLAEAGWVDRATAAEFGRRLSARYVLTGTLRRGRGDRECFVRLVQAESGRVVASADAYARETDAGDEDFFTLVAGRLRQAFPVLEGRARSGSDATFIELGRRDGVVVRMRFVALRPGEDIVDPASGHTLDVGRPEAIAVIEADDIDTVSTRAHVVSGALPSTVPVVSE